MNLELESMAIEMPVVDGHPNRQPFRGILTLVDVPSDRPPSGARGHRVMLTAEAAEAALPSLLGMGLDYAPRMEGHDARMKVGIITAAEIAEQPRPDEGLRHKKGRDVTVEGYVFAKDFPEIVTEIRERGKASLGMSYEIADVRVADVSAGVWEITEFTFTGAAVLKRDKAAYGKTSIELVQ
jgi:hypothetical protein